MPKRISARDWKARASRCRTWGKYLALMDRYLLQGSLRQACLVGHAAAEEYPRRYQPIYIELGIAEWLLDNYDGAVMAWRTGTKCGYGDAAGCMYSRLLLWFAGAMRRDEEVLQEAVASLEKALASLRAAHWPSPIARFLVGRISEGELFGQAQLEIEKRHPAREQIGWCGDFELRNAMRYAGAMAFRQGDLARAKEQFTAFPTGMNKAVEEHFETDTLLIRHELRKLERGTRSPRRRPQRPERRKCR